MMGGWKQYTLGDLCKFKYGQMPRESDLCECGYPVFSGYRIVGYANAYHYEEPEIIVVARGVGGTGDVKMSPHKCFLTNLSIVALVVSSEVDKNFLYYRLAGPKLWELRTGSAQAQITIDRLQRYELNLPPLPTQRKIAAILSAYDDLIENNLRRIKILEEMAQALYRQWFVKFRFPGHESARFVDSSLGRIPEGWEVRDLGALCELRKDKYRHELHSHLPLLNLARMLKRTLSVGEMGSPDELSTSRILFKEDDVLFGSIRPYLHKVALAPCRGVTNVSVMVIRPAEDGLKGLLAVLLSSEETVRWADQHSTGTKMPVIKWDLFRTMPMLIPEQGALLRFQEVVWPMLQTIKVGSARNRVLRRTRDLLLPRLISGGLDVSELDINMGGLDDGGSGTV